MKKRRRMLVYPPAQWRVIVWWIVLLSIFTAGVSWLIFYLSWSSALEWTARSGSQVNITEIFSKLTDVVILSLIGSIILGAVVGTIVGLFITHRLVGPIYRLKSIFQQLKQGKTVEEIRLRKGDEFHDLAKEFNSVLKSFAEIKEIVEKAKKKIEEISQKKGIDKSELTEVSQILEGGVQNEK